MSQFTTEFSIETNLDTDGVVINYRYFGKDGHTEHPYNKGRTTIHEVGHWLNLIHIWGDEYSCTATDFVDDTPNQFRDSGGCPSFPRTDNCSSTSPGIMFMNFMDYTDDACMNLFTQGQINRMRSLFDTQTGIRREMLTYSELLTNPPTISGPASACYEGSTFTLGPVPQGVITWTVTGPFSVSDNGATATVIRTGSSNTNGILKVAVNGVVVASKTITPCAPPTITGPEYITNYMSGAYTVNTTYPVYWSVTPTTAPGFQITSGQNTNNAYVKALYNTPTPGSPNGTLTATITLPGNSIITVSKTIKGVLPVTSILKPASPIVVNLLNSSGTTVSFYANPATSIYYDDYEWSIIPNVTSKHNFGSMLNVTFYSGGTYCINCRIASSYYMQPYPVQICFTVYESWGYAAYPNPASNILNIEINQQALAQSSEQATTSGKQLKQDKTYDIRLYDYQGNLLRQQKTKGGTVQFNVANLANGIYYLRIYDGVNEKPEMRQIVVEH